MLYHISVHVCSLWISQSCSSVEIEFCWKLIVSLKAFEPNSRDCYTHSRRVCWLPDPDCECGCTPVWQGGCESSTINCWAGSEATCHVDSRQRPRPYSCEGTASCISYVFLRHPTCTLCHCEVEHNEQRMCWQEAEAEVSISRRRLTYAGLEQMLPARLCTVTQHHTWIQNMCSSSEIIFVQVYKCIRDMHAELPHWIQLVLCIALLISHQK